MDFVFQIFKPHLWFIQFSITFCGKASLNNKRSTLSWCIFKIKRDTIQISQAALKFGTKRPDDGNLPQKQWNSLKTSVHFISSKSKLNLTYFSGGSLKSSKLIVSCNYLLIESKIFWKIKILSVKFKRLVLSWKLSSLKISFFVLRFVTLTTYL